MTLDGCIALVTGANRGIGAAFVQALLDRGAARVYATARDPEALRVAVDTSGGRLHALPLDVTDEDAVATAAETARDVTLLVNNAGVLSMGGFLGVESLDAARREMDTNYFGPLHMIRAFAPVLAANGGGAVINVISVAGHVNMPFIASYSASKAAAWSLSQGARAELKEQGTTLHAAFPGPVETEMADSLPVDKETPAAVVAAILDGVEAGEEDVYPDAYARSLRQKLDSDPKAVERMFAAHAGADRG